VFATYGAKVLMVPEEIVVADVRQLMDDGMTHLTFVDAEFFNSRHAGMRMLRRLHAEFPDLTYDLTTRVDHLRDNPEYVDEMAGLGVRVVTSALEYPAQQVLDALDKEITVADMEGVIAQMRDSGVALNPTFIMFNPWVGFDELLRFRDFVDSNGLGETIDPIQYETRLYLYKGSPLMELPAIRGLKLTEHEFHYDWEHDDPMVDELYEQVSTPPEPGVFKRCCLKC
jgi:radical SAM superfamily enzyme YgiQ (UPF0313 family)